MARYRIVCTDQVPITEPTTHAHIVAVGTGADPNKADTRWALNDILRAMANGDEFYTKGATSGKTTRVEKYVCTRCRGSHIRSSADAVEDNNLDSLRRCTWT